MRSLLLRDKVFLRTLYSETPLKCKKLLYNASDTELSTLIKFLHFLANGEITIKRKNFEIIAEKKKLLLIKKTLESKNSLKRFLSQDRTTKLLFLNKLCDTYEPLLYALFNEI
jgi:hypothetical protein